MPANAREKESSLHGLLTQLDRLEELKEELDELGIHSFDELDERIEFLGRAVEALEEDGDDEEHTSTSAQP